MYNWYLYNHQKHTNPISLELENKTRSVISYYGTKLGEEDVVVSAAVAGSDSTPEEPISKMYAVPSPICIPSESKTQGEPTITLLSLPIPATECPKSMEVPFSMYLIIFSARVYLLILMG